LNCGEHDDEAEEPGAHWIRDLPGWVVPDEQTRQANPNALHQIACSWCEVVGVVIEVGVVVVVVVLVVCCC
jgi:hypothetical protein